MPGLQRMLAVLLLLSITWPQQHAAQQGCASCISPANGRATCTKKNTCVIDCNPGYALAGKKCIKGCPAGKQLVTGGKCSICPPHSIKTAVGRGRCTKCAAGTFTVGQRAVNRDEAGDCLAGGLLQPNPPTKGASLQNVLVSFQDSLEFSGSFTGKGGGRRRRGCMVNCDAANETADAAEAFLAGSPMAYRSDEPLMGLPSRLPQPKPQAPCATVVGSAMSSVLEAVLASLKGTEASATSLSPTYAYFCSPAGARACTSGWTIDGAADAVTSSPADFFVATQCAGSGVIDSVSACAASAAGCGPSPVSACSVEALDSFYNIQQAIRRHGAVLSALHVDSSLKPFFDASPDGVYNATVDPNAKGLLRVAVALVGYNNTGMHWWVLLPLGEGFANAGLVKVSYGAVGVGNPEETYALNCRLSQDVQSLVPSRPVQLDPATPGCYWYTGQRGDYVAGVVDLFGVNIMDFVRDNAGLGVFDFLDTERQQPDLSLQLEGRRLHVCGVSPRQLEQVAQLECPAGQAAEGPACVVCEDDTYKPGVGPGPCSRCPLGTVTLGVAAADHDEQSDCKPASQYLLCEQYIGKANVSGVYNVTINGQEHQVFCDMETDGGGWLLVMNYNRKAGTAPRIKTRSLEDGFPILNNTELGYDESKSTGPGGSWGCMAFGVIGALPKLSEFRLYVRTGEGVIHVKSSEPNSFQYIRTGFNDFTTGGIFDVYNSAPSVGLQLVRMQSGYTPLSGHTQAWLIDLIKAMSNRAIMAFAANSLWVDGVLPDRKYNTHAQLWVRGSGGLPKDCPAGSYPLGWGCHICPEGSYKDTAGPGSCSKCPDPGLVTTQGAPMKGRDLSAHDAADDCKTVVATATVARPGGGWLDVYADLALPAPEAEAVCVRAGGHLVSVTSEEINQALLAVSKTLELRIFWIGLWSGGFPSHLKSSYRWLSGAVSRYNGWISGGPTFDQIPDKEIVRYVAWANDQYREDGKLGNWSTYFAPTLMAFVCERL